MDPITANAPLAMRHKLLRRRCIIREYDYVSVAREARELIAGQPLYDRVSFEPITRDSLEKQSLLLLLKDNHRWHDYVPSCYPINTLVLFRDYLYNSRYLTWTATYDQEGQMWIQSRVNTPRTRLGWGVFEKDLYLKYQ